MVTSNVLEVPMWCVNLKKFNKSRMCPYLNWIISLKITIIVKIIKYFNGCIIFLS